MELANKVDCTSCMNCILVCKQKAITISKDSLDNIYPTIDSSKCVECGICNKVCPALNSIDLRNPISCFAVHSTKPEIRHFSASGGVGTTLYRYCLGNNYAFSGVLFDASSLIAKHKIGRTEEDIRQFRNSKYTFSFMNSICTDILFEMKSREICFVGLPCQVAAIKRFIAEHNGHIDRLFTVDLVCHGVPSHLYLIDHIRNTLHADNVDNLSFRDETYQTSKFVFSASYKGKKYHKFVESNDNYQIGYHNATIYRPNCYNCHYARPERTGDITISDFTGFAKIAPFEGDVKHEQYLGLSCVLVNTEKGKRLFNEMTTAGMLKVYKRPLDEALLYEQQLKTPSKPSDYRSEFERLYPQNGFTKALNHVFRIEKIKRSIIKFTKVCVKFVLRRK